MTGGFQDRADIDVHRPFNVLCGVVLVRGAMQVMLSEGGSWPGSGRVGEALWDALDPTEVAVLPGTQVTYHTTPRDLEAGRATLLSVALSRPEVAVRLRVAREAYPTLGERGLRDLCHIDRSTWRRLQARKRAAAGGAQPAGAARRMGA